MTNLNTINSGLNTIEDTLAINTEKKTSGVKLALEAISSKLNEFDRDGLVGRKARKATKDSILNNLDGETNKGLLRAYNVAFTITFRDVNVNTEILSISQIENLVNHGSVNEINDLFESSVEDIVEYIKSLKTRIVETKTFERKK